VVDDDLVVLPQDPPFAPGGRFASLLIRDRDLAEGLAIGFEGLRDLGTFITHEGSHSLLYQHASIPHRLAMEQQPWLVEGIGAHFGNPRAYESPEEFARDTATRNVIATIDPEASGHTRGFGGFRFAYSAYGFFVDYLIKRLGLDAFHRFVAAYTTDPLSYRDLFGQVYGVDFGEAVRDFAASVGRGQTFASPGPSGSTPRDRLTLGTLGGLA